MHLIVHFLLISLFITTPVFSTVLSRPPEYPPPWNSNNATISFEKINSSVYTSQHNPCLKIRRMNQAIDCFETILHHAYGRRMTTSCPAFSEFLAREECLGCPWDHIDVFRITNHQQRPNSTLPFHPPKNRCNVADHVWKYRNLKHFQTYQISVVIIANLLISATFLYLTWSNTEKQTVAGTTVPDYLFMAIVWFLVSFGNIMIASGEGYDLFCSPAAIWLNIQKHLRLVSYFIAFIVSVRRYLHMPSSCGPSHASSWADYLTYLEQRSSDPDSELFCENLFFKRWSSRIFYSSIYVVAVAVFIAELCNPMKNEIPLCEAGIKDTFNGLRQVAKLILEICATVVYSFGGSKRAVAPWKSAARKLVLIVLLAGCIYFAAVPGSNSPSTTLFPSVLDFMIAFRYMQIGHISIVTVLAMFETYRFA